MDKAERHRALLELVSVERLRTQAELRAALANRYGIVCDQGTISRDIKELGLVRLVDANGAYYGRTAAVPPSSNEAFLLSRLVRRVQAAENLVVVHTDAANAHPVAEAIDRLAFPEVVGTVAGDNTVLVVAKTAAKAQQVAKRILRVAGLNEPADVRRKQNGKKGGRKP
ncbi:MAG: arginine repressor [Chloracidobacterium sp.]|nr:arginine repressor [Chloracidobacterium sp.]MDW8218626.1 arginine repressor [Acidobacteriota bacterium]